MLETAGGFRVLGHFPTKERPPPDKGLQSSPGLTVVDVLAATWRS